MRLRHRHERPSAGRILQSFCASAAKARTRAVAVFKPRNFPAALSGERCSTQHTDLASTNEGQHRLLDQPRRALLPLFGSPVRSPSPVAGEYGPTLVLTSVIPTPAFSRRLAMKHDTTPACFVLTPQTADSGHVQPTDRQNQMTRAETRHPGQTRGVFSARRVRISAPPQTICFTRTSKMLFVASCQPWSGTR